MDVLKRQVLKARRRLLAEQFLAEALRLVLVRRAGAGKAIGIAVVKPKFGRWTSTAASGLGIGSGDRLALGLIAAIILDLHRAQAQPVGCRAWKLIAATVSKNAFPVRCRWR